MTRAELVQRLRDTAYVMKWTAYVMRKHGGSPEAAHHAKELAGAAEIVGEWADELSKEETNSI